MNNCTTKQFLSPQHTQELQQSGIDAVTAAALGIRSVSGPELRRYGFSGKLVEDDGFMYLLFPYFDPWGVPITWENEEGEVMPFARVKLPEGKRNGKQKYAQPPGSTGAAYIPWSLADFGTTLGISRDGAKCDKYPMDLRVTEGEKKSIAATMAGYPCIGIGGINYYKCRWVQEYILNCRTLTVVFDSDVWSNDRIKDALYSFGVWAWGVTTHYFVKSQVLGGMKDERDRDAWLIAHPDDNFPPRTMNLNETQDCYHVSESRLLGVHLYYSLLPIGYEGQKLGIDDYLKCDCNADLRGKILGLKLPLVVGGKVLCSTAELWEPPPGKTSVCVLAKGDKSEFYWDWLSHIAKERAKDTKMAEMRKEVSIPWPRSQARDLLALLVAAHLDLSGMIYGDLSWFWDGEVWRYGSELEIAAVVGRGISAYGIPDGNTGIHTLAQRMVGTWLIGEFPQSDFIGLHDCDLNTFSGDTAPIHARNYSQYRVKHTMKPGGNHPLWDQSVLEIFGDRAGVFMACLRVAFAHPKSRGLSPFFPWVIGGAGIGKSALLRVLDDGLGGLVSMQRLTNLLANNANKGFIPLSWSKSRLIYDDDYKCQSKLPSEIVGLLNQVTTGSDINYRAMGKDVITLPCTFSMIVLSNKIPMVSGSDAEGFHRRFMPIFCEDVKRGEVIPDWHTRVIENELPSILGTIFSQPLSEAMGILEAYRTSEAVQDILKGVVRGSHEDVVEWLSLCWELVNKGLRPQQMDFEPLQFIGARVGANNGLPPDQWAWVRSSDAYQNYCLFCKQSGRNIKPKNPSHWREAIEKLGGLVPLAKEGGVAMSRRSLVDERGDVSSKSGRFIQLPFATEEDDQGDW